jgi:hypothetical protein
MSSITSDTIVHSWSRWGTTFTEGDRVQVKDIDGDAPTGDYRIVAIRVQERTDLINDRVLVLCEDADRNWSGWTNVLNLVHWSE